MNGPGLTPPDRPFLISLSSLGEERVGERSLPGLVQDIGDIEMDEGARRLASAIADGEHFSQLRNGPDEAFGRVAYPTAPGSS
jgi:hypothetical protein